MDKLSDDIRALFESNIALLSESLAQALQIALERYEELQQDRDTVSAQEHNTDTQLSEDAPLIAKGKLANIYISFLQSSVLCKLPWLRIDLYDENGITDMVECHSDWDVQIISDSLYQNADIIAAQKYEKENHRVSDYELEQVWLDLSHQYFEAFEIYLPHILNRCETASKLTCRWHYGYLLGRTKIIKELELTEHS